MKTDLFQCSGHCWVFQICWHIECSTFTASSFRMWNNSAGIPSSPLAFFHNNSRMGTIKDRKGKDLTEAERIKKRWQEYTKELFKKGLNDSDNHDGEVTHLEPDILEYIVKWALGSITMSKAGGGDQIPTELFQILKIMLLKGCTQYTNKFGQISTGLENVRFHSNPKERKCQRRFKLP